MKQYFCAALATMVSVLLLNCATQITPAPEAQKAPGLEDAAVSIVKGVHMVAQSIPWPGPNPIEQQVTPIRVSIENNNERPLRVRFSEFSLISPGNELYSALPLYRIEGTVSEYLAPVGRPGFRYHGFHVAPHMARAYPTIPPYTGRFSYDPMYQHYSNTYWRDVQLPTSEMWASALPEGVLDSGGDLSGWIYFEKVDEDMEGFTFRADLVDADSGRIFGEIRIPFVVE